MCTYQGCDMLEVKDGLCVFHLPVDSSGKMYFKSRLKERIDSQNYNFKGFIFPDIDLSQTRFESEVSFEDVEFNEHIKFNGSGFHGKAEFHNAKFLKGANFSNCTFKGSAHFAETTFENGLNFWGATCENGLSFERATISGGFCCRELSVKGQSLSFDSSVITGRSWGDDETLFYRINIDCSHEIRFHNCTIKSRSIIFNQSNLKAPIINFSNIKIETGKLDFERVVFDGNVDFSLAKFPKGSSWQNSVNFAGSDFRGQIVNFFQASFGISSFTSARFSGNAEFIENSISGYMNFTWMILSTPETWFNFRNPRILHSDANDEAISLDFSNVFFNEDRTCFEGFLRTSYLRVKFHYCQLRGVNFISNWMGSFEFRYGNIEEARFSANGWGEIVDKHLWIFRFVRNNVLREELAARKLIGTSTDLRAVMQLYQKLKVATDATHDYRDSGCFYFNKFEVERTLLLRELDLAGSSTGSWWFRTRYRFRIPLNIVRFFSSRFGMRFSLLSTYRLFTGYGEKPLWSFLWLIVFGFAFGLLQMFSGFTVPMLNSHQQTIQYLPCFDFNNHSFLSDFGYAVLFSFSHLNLLQLAMHMGERGLLPYDFGLWSLSLNIANSIVLLILLTFFAIGLQRQFKRF